MNRLLIGRCLSALATALIPTTLTLAVLRATGDGAALGAVLASEMVPLLLLLPVGGVLADRIRPQRVTLLADLTRCLSQAAIAVELLLGGTVSLTWRCCRRWRERPSRSAARPCRGWWSRWCPGRTGCG